MRWIVMDATTSWMHRSKNVTSVVCVLDCEMYLLAMGKPFFSRAYQILFTDTPVATKGHGQIM